MKIKTLIAAGGLGKRLQGFRGNESTKVLLEVKKTPMINLQIQKRAQRCIQLSYMLQ